MQQYNPIFDYQHYQQVGATPQSAMSYQSSYQSYQDYYQQLGFGAPQPNDSQHLAFQSDPRYQEAYQHYQQMKFQASQPPVKDQKDLKIRKDQKDQKVPVKPKRIVFTDAQRARFEQEFSVNKHPSIETRNRIAEELGISCATVKNFFQNRRAKEKKQAWRV